MVALWALSVGAIISWGVFRITRALTARKRFIESEQGINWIDRDGPVDVTWKNGLKHTYCGDREYIDLRAAKTIVEVGREDY